MKKIMLFIMLFMTMAFADDSYFAKVAARDAERAAERAETTSIEVLTSIRILSDQLAKTQMAIIAMQKQLDAVITQNNYLVAVIKNSKAVKDGVAIIEKHKETSKVQSNADEIIERHVKERHEAEIKRKRADALAIAIQEWQTCAQKYAVGQCTLTCTNEKPGLLQQEACRVKCMGIQKNKCGVKPTAMMEERKSEAEAFGFCLFTKDLKLAIL